MEAKAQSFRFLSNEGMVKIPFFQRGYVWKDENWDDLLTDLLDANKGHFLGSLILKQQTIRSGEPKEVLVVDGQQRLTTLSILLKVLYDTFTADHKKNSEIDLRNNLFHKRYPTDGEYLIKIQHSRVDAEAYQRVISAGIDGSPIENVDDSSNKILSCYGYFLKELREKSEDDRASLFNRILDPENRMLVVIDLAEGDDEQDIFDTINSSGVRLSCADTIKNALFQKAIQLLNQSKAIDLYNKTWEKVFLADDETIDFWETERITGRFRRNNIEIMLHCVAVIEGFYDPDQHTLSDLPKLYKKKIAKCSSKDELIFFINEIKDYADTYRERILSFDSSTLFSFNNSNGTQRLFHILETLQISTFHPFILFVFRKYIGDEYNISRLLSSLEKYVVRRMISGQETKSYNKLCRDFILNPDTLVEKAGEASDEEISVGLRKAISNKNAALLLFWVELYRRNNDNKFDMKELKDSYSLEHIMPQKWEQYWKLIPEKQNTDGSTMSHEEAKKDRYEKVYWLGNMTLLTSSLNSSLRNHDFEKKMNGEGSKKGIKAYAFLSITKDDIVFKFESGDTVWDESKIIARTSNLQKEILQIWGN